MRQQTILRQGCRSNSLSLSALDSLTPQLLAFLILCFHRHLRFVPSILAALLAIPRGSRPPRAPQLIMLAYSLPFVKRFVPEALWAVRRLLAPCRGAPCGRPGRPRGPPQRQCPFGNAAYLNAPEVLASVSCPAGQGGPTMTNEISDSAQITANLTPCACERRIPTVTRD